MKKAITFFTLGTLIIAVIGGLHAYDQSLAKATDILVVREQIQAIHVQLKQDQNLRRARDIDQRIWTLEQRYEGRVMPISVKEEMHRLSVELLELRGDK